MSHHNCSLPFWCVVPTNAAHQSHQTLHGSLRHLTPWCPYPPTKSTSQEGEPGGDGSPLCTIRTSGHLLLTELVWCSSILDPDAKSSTLWHNLSLPPCLSMWDPRKQHCSSLAIGLYMRVAFKSSWVSSCLLQMSASWEYSPTETAYFDELTTLLLQLHTINLLPHSVVCNKYTEFSGCSCTSVRLHSPPHPSFPVGMSIVCSLITPGRSTQKLYRLEQLGMVAHACDLLSRESRKIRSSRPARLHNALSQKGRKQKQWQTGCRNPLTGQKKTHI